MAATFPTGSNTFVPSTEATNNLVTDYSRNPSKFALASWAQYVPVKNTVGYWTEMTVEMAARLLNADGASEAWPDGNDAPTQHGNLESFEFKPFACQRFAPGFRIGEHSAAQATWDILAQHARHAAQRTITLRTMKAVTVATTAGNYPSAHTSAVSSINGVTGKWDLSTVARQDIKRSLDYAFEQINLSTLGSVTPDQVQVVLSPRCARKMAATQEIKDYIKGSPAAKEDLKTGLSTKPGFYGLPETYSGYKLVIEDAVRVTSRKGATKAASYVLDETTPFMTSRVGELEGVEGAPSFSTIQVFLYQEMIVESKHDRDNKVHKGRVIDFYDTQMVSNISGFLFTAAVTAGA